MTWTEVITLLIAAYAAIVSTGAFGWNVYSHFLGKGRLKVDTRLDFGAGPEGDRVLGMSVSMTNIGRLPIRADLVGGCWQPAREGEDPFTFLPDYLPKLLNPGESYTQYYDRLIRRDIVTPDLKSIWVQDAAGKRWHASRKNIKNLKTQEAALNKPSDFVKADSSIEAQCKKS